MIKRQNVNTRRSERIQQEAKKKRNPASLVFGSKSQKGTTDTSVRWKGEKKKQIGANGRPDEQYQIKPHSPVRIKKEKIIMIEPERKRRSRRKTKVRQHQQPTKTSSNTVTTLPSALERRKREASTEVSNGANETQSRTE